MQNLKYPQIHFDKFRPVLFKIFNQNLLNSNSILQN